MKATLEFNLPEEDEQLETAVDAMRYKLIVTDILSWFRDQIKYNDKLDDNNVEILENAREEVLKMVNESGVDL